MNLDAFNGLWVVCEANYVTDFAKDSFYRSMAHVTPTFDSRNWYTPFFSQKADADEFRRLVCEELKVEPDCYKSVPIASLKDLATALAAFVRIGREWVRFDNGKSASIEVLLKQIIERLVRDGVLPPSAIPPDADG